MFYSESLSEPDFNFAINSASNFDPTLSESKSESESESDFSSVFINLDILPETQSSMLTPFPGILTKISWSWYVGFNGCFMVSWELDAVYFPVDTGRKLNLHKTFNLCPVSTGLRFL